jgi:hypothetical protein
MNRSTEIQLNLARMWSNSGESLNIVGSCPGEDA